MKPCSITLLAVSLLVLVVYCPSKSLAQTYTESVLYNFPSANLSPSNIVLDSAGNLYGVTFSGGTFGVGSIFKVSANGVFSTIYSFNPNKYRSPNSGYYPWGLVIDSSGNLYGTTNQGGLFLNSDDEWAGVVFKFSTSTKKYTVLHRFGSSSSDGLIPAGPLTFSSNGNLYGMTNYGGTTGDGTIFEVTPAGVETVDYSFPATLTYPTSNVFRDSKGNFFGLADFGTTLFEVTAGGQSKILNNGIGAIGSELYDVGRSAAGNFYGEFSNQADSGLSYSGLWEVRSSDDVLSQYYFVDGCSSLCSSLSVPDGPFVFSNGNIYGTTIGARNATGTWVNGAVYEFSQATGVVNTLYTFCSLANCADGSQPRSGVAADSKGNLYGTTWSGGASGNGVVFKLTVSH